MVRPTKILPHLPPSAEDEILKALSFEVEDRHARARDFGEELEQALIEGADTAPHARLREPNLGHLVYKMCNRHRQVAEFINFFASHFKHHPGMPQIYLIRGGERECHDSLVERIVGTQVRHAAEKAWGRQRGVVALKRLGWAYQGELAALQLELTRMLFAELDPAYMEDDLSVRALCRLTSQIKSPMIVLQHRIHAGRWDRFTGPSLAWYVDYLSGIATVANRPQFLVFISILYSAAQPAWWKKWLPPGFAGPSQIDTQLRQIVAATKARCPCLMLSELLPLRQEDLKDWLSVNNIHPEKLRFELLEQIFQSKGGRMDEFKPMADVEHELSLLLDTLHRSFLSTRSYA